MSKIVIKNTRKNKLFINRLEFPETVNDKVYEILQSGNIPQILPVKIIKKRKEIQLYCQVSNMITLSEYFSGTVTKTMILNVVCEIMSILTVCKRNMWNENNLYLSKDSIFIESMTGRLCCIMWPIVNNKNENPPHYFLKTIMENLKLDPCEDHLYVQIYNDYFRENLFSLNSFEKMILKLQGKEVTGNLTQPMDCMKKTKSKTNDKNIEYDPFKEVENQKLKILTTQTVKKNQEELKCPVCGSKIELYSVFCQNCGNNLTKDLSVYLIRNKDQTLYKVDKFKFSVGRMGCDCQIDNKFIARHHADLIIKDGKVYIIDKNSLNKTFVNGKSILPETMMEIDETCSIRLANEEFSISIQ